MSVEEVLAGLDAEQRAVAEILEGPVMVLAGAGTGKTRAITHRIAHGVLAGAHDPHRTLAVTFTNRAAGELRGRLRSLGVEGVQARTFHAAALRQLRYFWPRISDRAFPSLMSSKASVVAGVLSAHGVSPDTSMVRDVSADIEWARVNFIDQHTIGTASITRQLSVEPEVFARVLADFEQAKADRGVIDFEDVMILLVGMLSTDDSIAREVRKAYRWLTVDEFQDVNPVQHALLKLWLGDRDDLCVVGDPSQTIYSFTGARSDFLIDFPRDFPTATTVRLVRCYRCTPQIVSLANGVIHAGVSARHAVTLRSERAAGSAPRIEAFDDDAAEAAAVAEKIGALIAAGVRPRDIAVLYRINAQQVEIESALANSGIPMTVRGSERFFERPEVREALTRLRGAARSADASRSVPDLVVDVFSAMGWSTQQPSTTGAVRERWESLAALVELARESDAGDLAEFVEQLDERASASFAPVADGVTLASIHAAKGLEWTSVFVIGCSDGLIPLQHADTPESVEEERRLLYVAITRAERDLTLSWARSRQPGGRTHRSVSRFLTSFAQAPADESAVRAGSGGRSGGSSSQRRKRRGPASCRTCGKALVTAGERTIGRCRNCPSTFDEDFFERLREWRKSQAATQGVPAYVVFTDATLIAIAEQLPSDIDSLSSIPGVGPAKLEAYATDVLAMVAETRL
ncbi:MAG: ATP-dependent DNA helicase UvrD2 [Actinomycetota bacterium]|nr:ATP-dependent DNA helicase UvrD2 [Actinomycetota bacterium]